MSRPVNLQKSARPRSLIFAARWSLAFSVLLSAAPALGTALESATPEQKRAAQKMFEAADGLYENGQYEQAAQAFRASYDLVASPNSRLMIARSLRELKRYEAAYQEYLATIKDAEASVGRYPDTLKAAQAEAEALGEQLSYLVIDDVPNGTELLINGKPVTFTPGERFAVVESRVEIQLRLPDGKVTRETLDLTKQETRHVTANETKPPEALTKAPPPVDATPAPRADTPNNIWRTAAYVAGGVGAAGLVTFGVFGVLDHSTYSDLQSKCNADGCASSGTSQIDKGRKYQTIANIGLGVGALGAAAAVTLFIVAPARSERAVAVQLGPGSLRVQGEF